MSLANEYKDKPFPYIYYVARKHGYSHEEALNLANKRKKDQQKGNVMGIAAQERQRREVKAAADKARQDQYLIAGGTTAGMVGGPIVADAIMSGGAAAPASVATPTGLAGANLGLNGLTAAAPAGEAGAGAAGVGAGAGAEAGTTAASSGLGAAILPAAAITAALALGYDRFGGRDILKGKADKEDYANMGSYLAPVVGAGFGLPMSLMGPLGLGIIGANLLGYKAGDLFKSKTKVEEERIRKLIDSGALTEEQAAALYPEGYTQKGQQQQLADILAAGGKENYAGFGDKGNWYNSAFLANKGDETYLAPEDVWGYASNIEAVPEWLNIPEWARRAAAKEALAKGLYREHYGTVDINDPVAFAELVDQILANEKTYGAGTEYQPEAEAGGYYWDPIEHKYKRAGEKEVKEETGVDLNSQGAPKL